MLTMVQAQAKPATYQLLRELSELVKSGVISYVLPALPVGSGFVIGYGGRPVKLEHDQADLLMLTAMHAGVYP